MQWWSYWTWVLDELIWYFGWLSIRTRQHAAKSVYRYRIWMFDNKKQKIQYLRFLKTIVYKNQYSKTVERSGIVRHSEGKVMLLDWSELVGLTINTAPDSTSQILQRQYKMVGYRKLITCQSVHLQSIWWYILVAHQRQEYYYYITR